MDEEVVGDDTRAGSGEEVEWVRRWRAVPDVVLQNGRVQLGRECPANESLKSGVGGEL